MSDHDNIQPQTEDQDPSEEELVALLQTLKTEHRRIDDEIKALEENGVTDMLKIKRMKKFKLSVKDQMAYLENMITPDIIA